MDSGAYQTHVSFCFVQEYPVHNNHRKDYALVSNTHTLLRRLLSIVLYEFGSCRIVFLVFLHLARHTMLSYVG